MKNKTTIMVALAAICVPVTGYAEVGSQAAWEVYFFAAVIIMALIARTGLSEAVSMAAAQNENQREDAAYTMRHGIPEAIGAGILGFLVFVGSGMAEIPIQHSITFGMKEAIISGVVIPLLLMGSAFLMGRGLAEALRWVGALIYFVRHRR